MADRTPPPPGDDPKFIPRFRETPDADRLSLAQLSPDPFRQFAAWYAEAVATEKAVEPNAFSLSTATPDGRPSSRFVLLKAFDDRGFVFFTNYDSRKGREIDANPFAAFLFYWPTRQRQVRIEGRLARTPPAVSDEYFQLRDRASQLASAHSRQSRPMTDDQRLAYVRLVEQGLEAPQSVPTPDNWGGYVLTPDAFDFMELRKSRMHDRVAYTKDADGKWQLSWLFP